MRVWHLDEKLIAQKFLRRINTTHKVDKAELVGETVWQRMMAGDFGYDAEIYYPEMMQMFDLGAEEPKWELQIADGLQREDQQGHQILREKYGKG